MTSEPWIIRGLSLAAALTLFVHWHSTGEHWAGLLLWLFCTSSGEFIIEVNRKARDGSS
jgi:hypothetical protein